MKKAFCMGFEFGYAQPEVEVEVLGPTGEEAMSLVVLPVGFDPVNAELPNAVLQADGTLQLPVCDDYLS